jgi:hypothetical protein
VAVAQLCDLRGARATVLATAAARESRYAELAAELGAAGLEPAVLEVPEGRTEHELLQVLDRLVDAVGPGERVIEADDLLDDALRHTLAQASEVVVNLAGGTTVMQYVVERIGAEAERLGVPVQRVAVVDRRSLDEQRANPYVVGELVRLGPEVAADVPEP